MSRRHRLCRWLERLLRIKARQRRTTHGGMIWSRCSGVFLAPPLPLLLVVEGLDISELRTNDDTIIQSVDRVSWWSWQVRRWLLFPLALSYVWWIGILLTDLHYILVQSVGLHEQSRARLTSSHRHMFTGLLILARVDSIKCGRSHCQDAACT